MAALTNTPTGTDETTVTTGNSAAGGNPWDLVTIGTGGTLVYDDLSGTTWYRFSTAATSSMVRAEWAATSILAAWSRVYGRVYFRAPTGSLGSLIINLARGRVGTTQAFRLGISTGLRLTIRNAANGAAATGGVPIAVDTTYRVEWDITIGGSATGVARLYLGDSTTELETITASAANFGTNPVNEVGFGIASATANHPVYWLRGFQANDTAMPGPQPPTGTTYDLSAPLSGTSGITGAPNRVVNVAAQLTGATGFGCAAVLVAALRGTITAEAVMTAGATRVVPLSAVLHGVADTTATIGVVPAAGVVPGTLSAGTRRSGVTPGLTRPTLTAYTNRG